MSVEIYNNFTPNIAQHIDARLATVTTVAGLPDPTVAANFIYEGAVAYVAGVINAHYKCVWNITSSLLEWVVYDVGDLVIGSLNITTATSTLDLSLVTPDITGCYAVLVNIVGGVSATIQSITNMPAADKQITFYVTAGQELDFVHFDYDVAASDQVVLENGFDMNIKGRIIGNESLTLKKHGTALCQWDATQFMKSTEWLQNLLNISIVDNLISTNTDKALSANQGRVLKDLVDTKQNTLTPGEKISLVPGGTPTSPAVINHIARTWVNVTPISSTNIPDIPTLQSLLVAITGVSEEYRYVDARGLGSNPNTGLWMLSPKKDPSLIANWIMLDAPTPVLGGTAIYRFLSRAFDLGNTNYPFIIDATSLKGVDLGVSFGASSILFPTEMNRIYFNSPGTYAIDFELSLWAESSNVSELNHFKILYYRYAGIGTGSTSLVNEQQVPMYETNGTPDVVSNRVHARMKYRVVMDTLGLVAGNLSDPEGTGVSPRINNNQSPAVLGDWTKVFFDHVGSSIQVTKIA